MCGSCIGDPYIFGCHYIKWGEVIFEYLSDL